MCHLAIRFFILVNPLSNRKSLQSSNCYNLSLNLLVDRNFGPNPAICDTPHLAQKQQQQQQQPQPQQQQQQLPSKARNQ